MANRDWVLLVGGAWDGTAGLKWSTTSGGVGGSAVPTTSDDVFLDSNSGTATITTASTVSVCNNLVCTGFAGTLSIDDSASNGLAISGSMTLSSGMALTVGGTNSQISFKATSTGKTVTTAGKSFFLLLFNGVGGGWTLQDNLLGGVSNSVLDLTNGSLDFGNKNVTYEKINLNHPNTRTLTLGSGTITLTGNGSFFNVGTATGLTFNANSSNVISSYTGVGTRTFATAGQTFNNFRANGAPSNGILTVTGSPTFNNLTLDADVSIKFTSSTTITASTFTALGTSGHPITIQAVTSGTFASLSVASGFVSCDWLVLKDSHAVGGATFYAGANSVDNGGNTGWIFTAPPPASGINYYERHLASNSQGM